MSWRLTYRRWVHGVCDTERDALIRGGLEADAALLRLRKQYDDLLEAHKALVVTTAHARGADTFSRMLAEMFEEGPLTEEEKVFLTPERLEG